MSKLAHSSDKHMAEIERKQALEDGMSDPSNTPEHQIGMLVHSIERDVDELKEIYLSLDGPDLLRTEIDRLRSAAKKLNRVLELVPRIQEIA